MKCNLSIMNYELYFVSALLTIFSEGMSGVFCFNTYLLSLQELLFDHPLLIYSYITHIHIRKM